MPVRVYDISKKLGLENSDVLNKAKQLGIVAAKVPSSSLDKKSAEWLEEELIKSDPALAARLASMFLRPKPKIKISVTSADFYRLAKQIFNQEIELQLDVSEHEDGEPLHLGISGDSDHRPIDLPKKLEQPPRVEVGERTKNMLQAAYYASKHNATDGWVNLAEYGGAVKKIDPAFQPQTFGERSLGSLMRRVTDLFELRNDESNPIVYYIRLKEDKSRALQPVPLPKVVPMSTLPKMATGKVHNLRLGFGFIMPDDGSENLFFHATDVEGCTIYDLKPGDSVEYEPGMNEKGPCGRKVRRLG